MEAPVVAVPHLGNNWRAKRARGAAAQGDALSWGKTNDAAGTQPYSATPEQDVKAEESLAAVPVYEQETLADTSDSDESGGGDLADELEAQVASHVRMIAGMEKILLHCRPGSKKAAEAARVRQALLAELESVACALQE